LIIAIVAGSLGGVNTIKIEPENSGVLFVKILWCDPFIANPALGLVKISILLFYKRIFRVLKAFHMACNFMITIIVLWVLTTIIIQLTMARPISGVWDLSGNFLVINYNAASLATAGISIGLDLITLCLPLFVIHRLQMKKKQKILIGCVFWLGGFCVIAGAIRFYYGDKEITEAFDSPNDNRYKLVTKVYMWDRIEPCASIVCACLPTFGPLLRGHRLIESIIRSAFSRFSSKSSRSEPRNLSDGEVAKSKWPWARLHEGKGTVHTVVTNNDLELESQTRLKSHPDQVYVTSEWEVDRMSAK